MDFIPKRSLSARRAVLVFGGVALVAAAVATVGVGAIHADPGAPTGPSQTITQATPAPFSTGVGGLCGDPTIDEVYDGTCLPPHPIEPGQRLDAYFTNGTAPNGNQNGNPKNQATATATVATPPATATTPAGGTPPTPAASATAGGSPTASATPGANGTPGASAAPGAGGAGAAPGSAATAGATGAAVPGAASAAPANVKMPATGNGGVTSDGGSPVVALALWAGAGVLLLGGARILRRRVG